MFETYSPETLRRAIEIELQRTDDAKTASIRAMKQLAKDPMYYDDMQKARSVKHTAGVITNKSMKRIMNAIKNKTGHSGVEVVSNWENGFYVIQKARDLSKLTKKIITDKKGHRKTVWVKTVKDRPEQKAQTMDLFGSWQADVIEKKDDGMSKSDIAESVNDRASNTLSNVTGLMALEENFAVDIDTSVMPESGPELPVPKEKILNDYRNPSGKLLSVSVRDVLPEETGQIRKKFNRDALLELADSIQQEGLIQPIIVRPEPGKEGKYRIIAGERRWRAMNMLMERGDLPKGAIDVIVQDIPDREKDIRQLIENHVRVDNTPLEIAGHYQKLVDRHGMSVQDIAKKTGSKPYQVRNYLNLNNLDPVLKKAVETKQLSKTTAMEIGVETDKTAQIKIYNYIVSKRYNSNQVREYMKTYKDQGSFFEMEDVMTDDQKTAQKNLDSAGVSEKSAQDKFDKFFQKQKDFVNKFLAEDGAQLSSYGKAVAGKLDTSIKEMELFMDQIGRVVGQMKETKADLATPSMFKAVDPVHLAWNELKIEWESLKKARVTKYIKKIPNPKGKGYLYFYNQAQINQYKKSGVLPGKKKKAEPKKEDPYANTLFGDWQPIIPDEIDEETKELPAKDITPQQKQEVINSTQFKSWFGDWASGEGSRVINEIGEPAENYNLSKPVKLYHGTSVGGFTEFSKKKSSSGLYGIGFYFTEDKEIAESYTEKDSSDDERTQFASSVKDKDGNIVTKIPLKVFKDFIDGVKLDRDGIHKETKDDLMRYYSGDMDKVNMALQNQEREAEVWKEMYGDWEYGKTGPTYTNPNWHPQLASAIYRATDNGQFDVNKFFSIVDDPSYDPGYNDKSKVAIDYKSDRRRGGDVIKHLFGAVLNKHGYSPVVPEPEVKEVYLNIRNPLDMDTPFEDHADEMFAGMIENAKEYIEGDIKRSIAKYKEDRDMYAKWHKEYQEKDDDGEYDGGYALNKQETGFIKEWNTVTDDEGTWNRATKYTFAELEGKSDKELREIMEETDYRARTINDDSQIDLTYFKHALDVVDQDELKEYAIEKGHLTQEDINRQMRERGKFYIGDGDIPGNMDAIRWMVNSVAKNGIPTYDPDTKERGKKHIPLSADGKPTLQHLAWVMSDGGWSFGGGERINDWAREKGYDGLSHTGGWNFQGGENPKHKVWIAFEPNQIKATTATEFNPASNNMYKAKVIKSMYEMIKARVTKFIKKIPNPRGKGYIYFYTNQQVNDYKNKGTLPGDQKGNWLSGFMNLFGIGDTARAETKIKEDYVGNNIRENFDLSLSGWKDHLAEYFLNKDKWSKFFEKTKGKAETDKDARSKADKDKKKVEKKKGRLKLSAMRFIHGLYGGKVEPEIFFDEIEITKEMDGNFNYASEGLSGFFSKDKLIKDLNNGSIKPIGLIEPKPVAKIEVQGPPTPAQDKEIQNDDRQSARDGYYNEKPSDVMNVGQDVWGAARHNFDTYEKFNYDLNSMEKDGSAQAFVNKKNLLGKYGLANKDERIAKGETEYKVLMSYAIRDYLANVPSTGENSRSAYYDFARALTRLDNETNNSKDFAMGLAEYASNAMYFPQATAGPTRSSFAIMDIVKEKEEDTGGRIKAEMVIGTPLSVFLSSILGNNTRREMYSMDKKEQKQTNNMAAIFMSENTKELNYDDLYKKIFGATKAAGIKVKKGDAIKFTEDMKDRIYLSKSSFDNDEKKAKWHEISKNIQIANEQYGKIWVFDRNEKLRKEVEAYFGQTFENQKDAETKTRIIINGMYDERKKYITITNYFPEEDGQVVRAGKEKLDISFKFATGDIKTFRVKPDFVKAENIESIQKTATKQTTAKLNLFIESMVKRKGGHDFSDITTRDGQKKLKDDYGFKAVQYGNSMPDDEKRFHTQWTLESMSDLSDILGLPIDQITAKGKLGIGFGARGKGGGGPMAGAIAHYEPGQKMINLTRSNGFGSLAHEWAHFSDNILSDDMGSFITSDPGYKIEKFGSESNIPEGAIIEQAQKKRRGSAKGGVDRFYFDKNKQNTKFKWTKLKKGQVRPDDSNTYSRFSWESYSGKSIERDVLIPKDIPYRSVASDIAQKSLASYEIQSNKVLTEIEEIHGKDSPEYRDQETIVSSSYYRDGAECFARAFECYVADKLSSSGRENTYLASKRKTEESDGAFAYPQQEFRAETNMLFDKFFDLIRTGNELQKALDRIFNPKTAQYEYGQVT